MTQPQFRLQPWLELKLWDPLAHIARQRISKFQLIPRLEQNGTVAHPKLEFQHGGSRGQNSSNLVVVTFHRFGIVPCMEGRQEQYVNEYQYIHN
jgi:hypothetical protein